MLLIAAHWGCSACLCKGKYNFYVCRHVADDQLLIIQRHQFASASAHDLHSTVQIDAAAVRLTTANNEARAARKRQGQQSVQQEQGPDVSCMRTTVLQLLSVLLALAGSASAQHSVPCTNNTCTEKWHFCADCLYSRPIAGCRPPDNPVPDNFTPCCKVNNSCVPFFGAYRYVSSVRHLFLCLVLQLMYSAILCFTSC